MDLEEIKELVRLMSENDITELSIEREGVKVSLRKGTPAPVVETVNGVEPQAVPAPQTGTSQPGAAGDAADPDLDEEQVAVVAPMVGTFYRAPAPDADPYVNEGDRVEVGQPLCIIEAMKLMNEIESEVSGRVTRILVENGQPVEYGQALFLVKTT